MSILMKNCLTFFIVVLLSVQTYASSVDIIKVGVHIEPPAIDFINNEYVGRNIEVAKALAKSLGKEITFLTCPFARCLSMMKAGQVDMLVGIVKNKTRQVYISYLTTPIQTQYFPLRFYLNKDNPTGIDRYEDLEELIVGVLRGASYFEQFDQDKQIKKITMANHRQLIEMLRKKRIDTFLEREESVLPWFEEQDYEKEFKLAKYQYSHAVKSYIGLSKKSAYHHELEKFSLALSTLIKDGAFNEIFEDTAKQ